jgi:subtilisin family serine protease
MKLIAFLFLLGMSQDFAIAQDLRFQDKTVSIESLMSLASPNHSDSHETNPNDAFLVQYAQVPGSKERQQLEQLGLMVLNYFPDNAFVVRGMTPERFEVLLKKTKGVVKFPSRSKLSVDLPQVSVFNKDRSMTVHIVLWSSRDVESFVKSLPPNAILVDVEKRYLDLVLPGQEILRLAESSFVESVEPAIEVELMYANLGELSYGLSQAQTPFPLTGFETGTRLMGFDSAWSAGFRGQGQTVAVADTGLDRGEGNLSKDFAGGVMEGLAVGVGAKNWQDPMGHGTHVAGSIASRGGNSEGRIKGGAYEAQLFILGMWSPIMNNLSVPPRLSRLFEPALERGIKISSNSWGSPASLGAYNSMAVQADEWTWENLDFLALFAAGNSGADKDKNGKIDEGSVSSPGTAKNILTIGASENQVSQGGIQRPIKDLRPAQENWPAEPIYSSFLSDNPRGIAAFSSRGPTRDQRLKPEVVAPGSNVLSSFSQEPGASTLWGAYDAFYVFSGGTSMSTPLVAGAAAVTRQILVERGSVNNPSASLIKALLMLGAEDLAPGQYGTGVHQELKIRPDNHQGFGLVQLSKIRKIIEGGQFLEGVVKDINQPFTRAVTLSAGDELEVLLVYTDAPGTTNSSRALVNDLDLLVSGPGHFSMVSRSRVDNFEYLKLKAAVAGQYSLNVVGARIAVNHPKLGGQPFSLVFDRH